MVSDDKSERLIDSDFDPLYDNDRPKLHDSIGNFILLPYTPSVYDLIDALNQMDIIAIGGYDKNKNVIFYGKFCEYTDDTNNIPPYLSFVIDGEKTNKISKSTKGWTFCYVDFKLQIRALSIYLLTSEKFLLEKLKNI